MENLVNADTPSAVRTLPQGFQYAAMNHFPSNWVGNTLHDNAWAQYEYELEKRYPEHVLKGMRRKDLEQRPRSPYEALTPSMRNYAGHEDFIHAMRSWNMRVNSLTELKRTEREAASALGQFEYGLMRLGGPAKIMSQIKLITALNTGGLSLAADFPHRYRSCGRLGECG